MNDEKKMPETVLSRLKRMQAFKHRKLRFAEYLETNDGDFRFEIAVLGLREVLRKYSVEELAEWSARIERSSMQGNVGSNVYGAGGGGGSGNYVYTVPQGVSQLQITAVGGGGGGRSNGVTGVSGSTGGYTPNQKAIAKQNKMLKQWWSNWLGL